MHGEFRQDLANASTANGLTQMWLGHCKRLFNAVSYQEDASLFTIGHGPRRAIGSTQKMLGCS